MNGIFVALLMLENEAEAIYILTRNKAHMPDAVKPVIDQLISLHLGQMEGASKLLRGGLPTTDRHVVTEKAQELADRYVNVPDILGVLSLLINQHE